MDTSPNESSEDSNVDAPTEDMGSLLDSLVPDSVHMGPNAVRPLTEDELQFVTYCHQIYALEGSILSEESAKQSLMMPPKEYQRLMSDDRILAALEERGVRPPVGTSNNVVELKEWQKNLQVNSLTSQQLLVANAMLDLVDTRSQKKKLQDLGVSTQTYATWLKDAVFQNYLRTRAESMLGENQHEAALALLDKVRMGDIKAIELYYEMQGIYTRASASQVNAQQVAVDVQNLIVSIIEIITDEVDDFQVAARISNRMKGLIQARTIANDLVNGNVNTTTGEVLVKPDVVKAPELSPELKELMGHTADEELGEGNG